MNIGDKAPDFTLLDGNGNARSLSEFANSVVVLYFYSKDNTPGCTRQACAFAALHDEFRKRNITVIGISKDSVESHRKFAGKHALPFILLADPLLEVCKAYGVWKEQKLYGKTCMKVVRTTFIINGDGIIEKIMPKVKPDTNAAEILELLDTGC